MALQVKATLPRKHEIQHNTRKNTHDYKYTNRRLRSSLTMYPNLLNGHSEEALVPQIHRYIHAKLASAGKPLSTLSACDGDLYFSSNFDGIVE